MTDELKQGDYVYKTDDLTIGEGQVDRVDHKNQRASIYFFKDGYKEWLSFEKLEKK